MRFDILLAAAVITKVAADGVSFAFEAFLQTQTQTCAWLFH
jgi:hypothetical protein